MRNSKQGGQRPVRSGPYDFWLDRPYRGSVEITDAESGEQLGAALVREGCFLGRALPHADGLMVTAGTTWMKVRRNTKGIWAAVPATTRDLAESDLGPTQLRTRSSSARRRSKIK